MEEIIEKIYKDCDPTNSNSVSTAVLIDYVRPFMPDNKQELEILYSALDPANTNPFVSYENFYSVMSDWIAKIEAKNSESRRLGENNSVSTFFNSFNASNVFNTTNNSNNNNNMTQSIMGEENRKLQYELTKTTTELKLVTQQLLEAEETIKKMGFSKIEKAVKVCNRIEDSKETSIQNQTEIDDLLQEIDTMKQKHVTLEKMLKSEHKQNELISNQMLRLENENINLENKLEKITKNNHQHIKLVNQLENTIDEKDSEISLYAEVNADLKLQLDEKSELISFYLNENKLLKEKLQYLEKLMKEIEYGSVHASSDLSQSLDIYNTPKFLKQLANPVTPTISSPVFKVRKGSTSSPIKHDNTSTDSDYFIEPLVYDNLKGPNRNLKEELTSIFPEDSKEEVKRLQAVLNEEEMIKKHFFEDIKKLSEDNGSLQNYKKKYDDLRIEANQYEIIIEELKNTLKQIKKDVPLMADKSLIVNFNKDELEDSKKELDIQKEINLNLNIELDKLKRQLSKLTSEINDMELKLNENTLLQLKDAMQQYNIDRCCQTDFVETPKISNSLKTGFTKQQIRLERLHERISTVENELLVERSINVNLEKKRHETLKQVEALIDEIESHKQKCIEQTATISSLLTEKMIVFEKTAVLESKVKSVDDENKALTEELKKLIKEKDISNQNLQHALARLSTETLQTNELRKQNEVLLFKTTNLEHRLELDFIKQIRLRKRLIDLKTVYTRGLQEKCVEIKSLKKKTEINSIISFLCAYNKDLIDGLLKVVTNFNFNSEMRQFLNERDLEIEEITIESELELLNSNIKWVLLLFEIFEEKFLGQVKAVLEGEGAQQKTYCVLSSEADDSSNDSDFLDHELRSDLNNSVALYEKEVQALILFASDSFLDNLELNDTDLRRLAQNEMEEKFTALALSLTMDIPTSTSRFLNEKDHLERLLVKYFASLKYNIELLSRLNLSELKNAINCLQMLKNLTEDVLKSAVSYGVLQYEKRTVNCWHLVINYVATLSRQLKEIREVESKKAVEFSQKDTQLNCVKCSSRSSCLKTVKFYVLLFLFLLLLFVAILFFYIDSICSKDIFLCPFESVLNLVIDKKSVYRFQS